MRQRLLGFLGVTFDAISIPAFRYYWLSNFSATTAMQVQTFARALLAYELSGSASAIGLVLLGQAIPQTVLSMFGGALADRMDRRRLIMMVQFSKVLLALLITALVLTDSVTVSLLFVSGVLQGVILAFSGPPRTAIVAEIVPAERLMNALALNNTAANFSRLGAPSLAAVLVSVSWIDIGGLYVLQAVLDLLSFFCLLALPFLKDWREGRESVAQSAEVVKRTPGIRAMLREQVEGYRYVFASPVLVTLLSIALVPTLLGQSYQQFLPVFAKDVFGNGIDRNAAAIGFMGTMSGVGALVGSFAVASAANYHRRALMQLIAGLGFGASMLLFATQSFFPLAVLGLVLVGFTTAFLTSLNTAMLFSVTDKAYYGRVVSVNMMNLSFGMLGAFITGYLIDWAPQVGSGALTFAPVQAVYAGIGLLIMLFMVAITVFNPSYRRLGQGGSTEEIQPPKRDLVPVEPPPEPSSVPLPPA
jgi:MFS family permease